MVVTKMKSGFEPNYYESRIEILKSVQYQLSPATKQVQYVYSYVHFCES